MLSRLVDSGRVPDSVLRTAIRTICMQRLLQERGPSMAAEREALSDFVARMRSSPLAVDTDAANNQHYRVPPGFFELVLGPHLKYSCCLFPDRKTSLEDAERLMLDLTLARAQVEDGMKVLDLGCGWGSLTLHGAARHRSAQFVAVSNSPEQRKWIEASARSRNLGNVQVITADVNDFSPKDHGHPPGSFDRVVSVEMFEHLRNHALLLERIAEWLNEGGKCFVHHFAHRRYAYLYEDKGEADWMTREFFTGGMMPSADLLMHYQRAMTVDDVWYVDGGHYAATSEAWLQSLDRNRPRVMDLFEEAYGAEASARFHRWRVFFLAVAELFGFRGGREWLVCHYRFNKRDVGTP